MPRRSIVVAATVASVIVAVLVWFAVGPDGGRDGSAASGGAESRCPINRDDRSWRVG